MTGELSKTKVIALLRELGERLAARGIHAEMYVVGGAAMALAYDVTRLTRDLDAIFVPKMTVYEEAAKMAEYHKDLDPNWLNDAVKGLLPSHYDREARTAYNSEGIDVSVASPEHLLAMKVQAAREERDSSDILILCKELNVRSIDQVLDIAEDVYGPGRLQPKSRFMVQQLLQDKLPQSIDDRYSPSTQLPCPSRSVDKKNLQAHCGRIVPSTRLPCFLAPGHGGNCRSRRTG